MEVAWIGCVRGFQRGLLQGVLNNVDGERQTRAIA
jgi:hypothetical protein